MSSSVLRRRRNSDCALSGSWRDLHSLAARGGGMAALARSNYGSNDWNTVLTAFHEAGHAVAARAQGLVARVEIHSPTDGFCHVDMQAAQSRGAQLIALAGQVAQNLARDGLATPSTDLIRFPEDLSESDRLYAGAFGLAEVAAAADLVWSRWADVTADARNQMLWLQRIWRSER